MVWNIEGVSILTLTEDDSSLIEGGGEGETGVTCNGVKSCVEDCLMESINDGLEVDVLSWFLDTCCFFEVFWMASVDSILWEMNERESFD